MQTAIERGGLKLISDQELELDLMFDLRKDPGETTDLSQSHPAARDLAWRLQTWRQAQLDYFSSPERYRKEYPPILVEK
jgi:arylsulfatase A-like enzyme